MLSEVSLGPWVGRWGRASVYSAIWHRQHVAVMVRDHLVSRDGQASRLETAVQAAARSPALLHPKLVRVHCCAIERSQEEEPVFAACSSCCGCCIQQDTAFLRRHYMVWTVCELCPLGSLAGAVKKGWLQMAAGPAAPLNLLHILLTAHEIASALSHMHGHGVAHGHLDLTSVLLARNTTARPGDSRRFTAKVSTARHFGDHQSDTLGSLRLNRQQMAYLAPEVLMGHVVAPAPPSDVYAFGIVCWEMLNSQLAWTQLKPAHVVQALAEQRAVLPPIPDCPADIQDLVSACLSADMATRPGFSAIAAQLEAMLPGYMRLQKAEHSRSTRWHDTAATAAHILLSTSQKLE